MPNLFDFKCPYCGDENTIDILIDAWVRVTEDGTDADRSHDSSHCWDEGSMFQCGACSRGGQVRMLGGGDCGIISRSKSDNCHYENCFELFAKCCLSQSAPLSIG